MIDAKPTSTTVSQRETFRASRPARIFRNGIDRIILQALSGSHKILDVGCGEGILLEKIKGRVIGVDLSPENVAFCRSLGLDARTGDCQALPLADTSFDACLLMSVIEHMAPEQVVLGLAEVWRVLVPSGRLIVTIPNDKNYRVVRQMSLQFAKARMDYGHVARWTPRLLNAALVAARFNLVRAQNVPRLPWPFALQHIGIYQKAEN